MDYTGLILLAAMFAVFYFMLIRPENKRKKAAEEMRNNIKKGERITTIGGLVGKVVQVNDSTVVFETSEDRVRIEVAKWGVQSTESTEKAEAEQKTTGFLSKKSADQALSVPDPERAEREENGNPEVKS